MTSRARAAGRRPAAAPAAPSRFGWWKHPALGPALLALLLFLPVVRYGFVRDDRDLFADNPFMKNPGQLLKLLTSDFWSSTGADSGLWRPLVTLSYWLDGRIAGWQPAWFHTVNLFSHVGVTALVAIVMLAAGAPAGAAAIGALWFALLPAHVEPVAWISGRTDIWCALFGLLAIALQSRSDRGWGWRVGAVAAFALALLSKEAAIPVLAVVALLVWQWRSRSENRIADALFDLAPFLLLTLAWGVAHLNIAPSNALATTPGWHAPSAAERLWTALALFPSQLAFLLPGFRHGPDWAIAPASSPADFRVALGLVLHLAAGALLVRTWKTRGGVGAAVLLLWLPSLLMAGVTLTRGVILDGERNVYLGSVGAAWLIGVGGLLLWRRGLAPTTFPRGLLAVLFVALLGYNAWDSLVQMAGWRTDATMYRAMIAAQPKRADGYLGLALVSIGARNDRTALRALEQAERIDSTRYEIATYRAAIASRHSDWPEVIRWSRNAIRRGARESDPWLMEINALQSLKLWPWARTAVETLMAHHKSDPDVAAAYARQMLGEDVPARAVKPLEYAIGWNPNEPSLHVMLGDAYARLRRPEKAIDEFKRAVGIAPQDGDAWIRLAVVYHSVGAAALRDEAIRNAASLPGADTTRLRRLYDRMLEGGLNPPPPREPSDADPDQP